MIGPRGESFERIAVMVDFDPQRRGILDQPGLVRHGRPDEYQPKDRPYEYAPS